MGDAFWPGDLGFVVGEMVGGPLDGRRYKDIPVLPGGPPTNISIPLGDASTSPQVTYRLRDESPDEGVWKYDFEPSEGASVPTAEAASGTTAPPF